jgi:uncharacterized protein involved in exopolysaccharide biosynthesis
VKPSGSQLGVAVQPFEVGTESPQNGSGLRHLGWAWLLWEHRGWLLRLAARALLLATIVAFLLPKRYESTTRLMPPDPQGGSGIAMLAAMASSNKGTGAGLSGLGGLAGDLLGMKSSSALFVDILHSRTVEDRLIERFDLRKVYWARYWEDARKALAKNTEIDEDRKSGVITLTVRDRDPNRAAQLAQGYVEELNRLVADVSTSSARRERIFIEQRLATVRKELDRAEQEFSQFASKNSAIDIKEQTKAMVESGAVLQGQLIAAQSELQGLEQIYTPNNVRVRSLKARVAELEHQLQKLSGDSSAPSLDGNADNLYPPIRQLPLLGVRWAELYRETKIQETVYELLTQQYELARIQEAKEIPTVKVFDVADVPETKSSPHRLLIMLLSTFLALAGGAVWLLGIAVWQEVDAGDPRKIFAQDVASTLHRKGEVWQDRLQMLRTRFHKNGASSDN